MLRKILATLAAVMALCAVTSLPAGADAEQSSIGRVASAVQAPTVTTSTDAAATGWAMGGYPNYWTICAINGVGGTDDYWPNLVRQWTWTNNELNLIVGNRCDGYSATNKFIFKYLNTTTNSCGTITNNHKTWSPARGKYIFDQVPTVWININDKCTTNAISYDHQVQEYVGWLLGLAPDNALCSCVMGNTTTDRNNVRYVVYHDIADMNVVYRH